VISSASARGWQRSALRLRATGEAAAALLLFVQVFLLSFPSLDFASKKRFGIKTKEIQKRPPCYPIAPLHRSFRGRDEIPCPELTRRALEEINQSREMAVRAFFLLRHHFETTSKHWRSRRKRREKRELSLFLTLIKNHRSRALSAPTAQTPLSRSASRCHARGLPGGEFAFECL